ncbi:MAG: T9SS type A sorting domain-containing protein, partial [bacterium]|nr:T9SS type A sorting domain-containing protein [bacterium]
RPWIELDSLSPFTYTSVRNGVVDSLIEPGDTVYFSFSARNWMRPTFGATATLTGNNPDITINDDHAVLATSLFGTGPYTNGSNDTISFIMPDSIQPIVDSFFVTIETDSTIGSAAKFSNTFAFELRLGSPAILIVDDDRGGSNEQAYVEALGRMRLPVAVWNVVSSGKPTAADLNKYSMVFWVNGWNPGVPLTEQDMTAMKSFMNGGGNLFLSTDTSGVSLMGALDASFMTDYLHTQYAGSDLKWFILTGSSGDPIWGGLRSIVVNALWQTSPLLTPINGGETALVLGDTNDVKGVCGVSYSGTFKSIVTTFPPESINNNQVGFDPIDSLMTRVIEFFGLGFKTGVAEDRSRAVLPQSFTLEQNYPNPFNPSTNISYTIKKKPGTKGPIKSKLAIFNLLGREVRVLVDQFQSPGRYSVSWDGLTTQGTKASSGIYFYRLTFGDQSQTRKMVLLK